MGSVFITQLKIISMKKLIVLIALNGLIVPIFAQSKIKYLFSKKEMYIISDTSKPNKVIYSVVTGGKVLMNRAVGNFVLLSDNNFVKIDNFMQIQRVELYSKKHETNIQIAEKKYLKEVEKSSKEGFSLNEGENKYILLPKVDTISVLSIKDK